MELADGPLRDPVLEFGPLALLRYLLVVGAGSDLRGLGGLFILDAGLVGVLVGFGDAALALVVVAPVAFTLDAAFDDDGVRVDELDGDVLLVDARQLALEFVGVFDFADVELGLEGADGGGAA